MKTWKFSKRALSIMLSLIMVFSMIPVNQAFADDSTTENITVYVTVSDKGTLATAKDGSYMANVPVTLSGEDIVLDDVFAALHETYYADGGDGYSTYEYEYYGSTYTSVGTLWGDTSGAFGFYRNNLLTASVDAESVCEGDYITAFIYSDQIYWSDMYAYFEDNEVSATTGQEVTFTLDSYSYDSSWNLVSAPLEGAELTVYKEGGENGFSATGSVTDEYGQATYSFSEAGTYIVSATAGTAAITAPVCIVTVVEGVGVTVAMNAVSTTMSLATTDGQTVDVGEPTGYVYTFYAEPGEYILTGYGTDGSTISGTIALTVTDSAEQSYTFQTVTAYASNSGWTYGTDYDMDVTVYAKTGELRTVTMGDSVTSGRKTFLLYKGDTYRLTKTPLGDRAESYTALYAYGTVTANVNNSTAIPTKQTLSVTVPSDKYELEVGTLVLYYVYNAIDAVSVVSNEDGTVTYTYSVAKSSTYYYRVSDLDNNDAVTYADWISIKADSAVEVTESDMYVNAADGTDYDSDTIIDDLSVNPYDVADIYLNINEQGYLKLNSGDTFQIVNVRNWLPIEGTTNAKAIEPDFRYTVIDENGNASDVISVNGDGVITANKSGTAIVLVTYDSVINNSGWGQYTFFSAIWPENTGVFIVSVDDDTSFDTGMTLNSGMNTTTYKLAGDYIDAELDVLYYLKGEDGAEYTFTPAEGTTVTVLNPTLTERSLTYTGYDDSGVTYNNDGSITISGLTEGRNIVKLTNGDSTEYQVITVKEADYTVSVTDADGNEVDVNDVEAGDTVTVKFSSIYHPANKLSGLYNMSAKIQYTDPAGNTVSGTGNQYLFAATQAAQTITFTIPEDYEGCTYTLSGGVVYVTGYGSAFGSHRNITYTGGKPADFTAVMNPATLCSLPDIEILIGHNYVAKVTAPTCTEQGYTTYTCTECGDSYVSDYTDALGHTYVTTTTKATTSKAGSIVTKCDVCGDVKSSTTIAKIASVTLSKTSYTYTGSAFKPTVTVKDSAGKKISSSNYTVTYSNNTNAGTASVKVTFKGNYSGAVTKTFKIKAQAVKSANVSLSKTSYVYTGKALKPSVTAKNSSGKKISSSYYTVTYSSNKNVGKATVTIKFKGNYSGTIKKTFTIKPKATKITKKVAVSKGIVLTWKKVPSQATGYQIQYSTSSKFASGKTTTKTVTNYKTLSKAYTKLKSKTKYYIRIRTYKTVSGKKYYSAWSSKVSLTTKK